MFHITPFLNKIIYENYLPKSALISSSDRSWQGARKVYAISTSDVPALANKRKRADTTSHHIKSSQESQFEIRFKEIKNVREDLAKFQNSDDSMIESQNSEGTVVKTFLERVFLC